MKTWWVYALLGAIAGGLMPVFVKRGLKLDGDATIDSNLATAVRIVMLILPVWALVWYQGTASQVGRFSKMNWLFLALSALATGGSWLFSFKALEMADASKVMPIDKVSLVVTVIVGILFLGEAASWRIALGVVLIMAGSFLAVESGPSKTPGGDSGSKAVPADKPHSG